MTSVFGDPETLVAFSAGWIMCNIEISPMVILGTIGVTPKEDRIAFPYQSRRGKSNGTKPE